VRLVACGAPAGGLEAFSQLLASLPDDLDGAVVFVQHLAPEHESMLASLLQHRTRLRVVEARDEMTIERATVYVAPPGNVLDVCDGTLRASRSTERYSPIDY